MALCKLALVFALITFFLGRKKPTAAVIFGATVLLGLLFGLSPLTWLTAVGRSLISWDTWQVVCIIWSVMLLEGVMSGAGFLEKMMQAVEEMFHSRRVSIFSMPMLIGFLPSAGGALFSAPLVEQAAQGLELSPERKARINIYFRHIMEICFPTYPASIIICQLSGLPLSRFVVYLLPVTVFAFVLGLWMLRDVPQAADRPRFWPGLPRRTGRLLLSLWPFILLLVLIMACDTEVFVACLITLVAVMIASRTPLATLPQLVMKKTKWPLLLMALSVMVFKDVLLGCGAVEELPDIIAHLPVPPVLVFSLLALFIGLITGMILSASAITVPLAMAALPDYTVATVVLLHLSAYIGCQLTPTHLCVSLSADYFQANLQRVIAGYLPLYAILYVCCLVVFGFVLG